MNIETVKPSANAILVNESNLPTGIIYKNKATLHNVKFWHKFIVINTENLSRNDILKAILDHVHPLDLIPVFFAKDKLNTGKCYFMARNCGAAIEKLCKDNLIVPNPMPDKAQKNNYRPFKLSIVLNFSTINEIKVDVQKNVLSVLTKRYDPVTKTLNLRKFYEDKELTEFCPLSQPKIMYFVLHIAKTLQPEEIILAENSIKLINPFEVLTGLKITYVDLSNNMIPSMYELSPLKTFNLKQLNLDGNALCNEYDEEKYLDGIKEICPNIEILDGIFLRQGSFPLVKRNFLCNPNVFDLVNQFVEYFFTLYDSRNRRVMEELYHKYAMFSMTTSYHPNQISSPLARLKHYNIYSRNLYKSADLSRSNECLYRTRAAIMNIYSKLPQTEHDPYSFTVDVVQKTAFCVIIVVNGVFRELAASLLDSERILGFCRTFVLEILNGDGECVIVNEQLHLYNALSCQQTTAFKETKPMRLNMPKPQSVKDQNTVVQTLQNITNLERDWSKKCLEECDYNLKQALELFVDLYKAEKIPKEAFFDSYK